MARVVVIGGGLGGLACAVRLAKLRHDVVVLEATDRLGGALAPLEQDGFHWDGGPTATALPGVVRDLFRKSGRPLEKEVDLVALPVMREHRFEDDTTLALPSGRTGQAEAVEAAFGRGGESWLAWTESFHDEWEVLRRSYLERPWTPAVADRATRSVVQTGTTLHKRVRRSLRDRRLRSVALHHAVVDGHDPRNAPAWWGAWDYVEQKFGLWTVPGGLSTLTGVLEKRLGERRVVAHTDTPVLDLVLRDGRAVGVRTADGDLAADLVVCAVDPRRIPALARYVARTTPALPPVVCHLGLAASAPAIPHEIVFHRDPYLVVRPSGVGPDGGVGVTLLGRAALSEDIVVALARYGLDLRPHVVTRLDHTPRQLVERLLGSPYGVAWQGPRTLTHRLSTATPVPGVLAAGAHASPGAGVPLVGLSSALVAETAGPA